MINEKVSTAMLPTAYAVKVSLIPTVEKDITL